jgi:sorbose reductase
MWFPAIISNRKQGKAYSVNTTSYEAVQDAVDTIVKELGGRLDVFVANSGVTWEQGALLDGDLEHYRKVMGVNVDGTFYCARVAGQHWRRQKREGTTLDGRPLEGYTTGSFIATASISASIVNIPQLQATYNASKAAVAHMCRSLAVEWAGFARANSVSPGYIKTEISNYNSAETKATWKDKIPMGESRRMRKRHDARLTGGFSTRSRGRDRRVEGRVPLPRE